MKINLQQILTDDSKLKEFSDHYRDRILTQL